MNVFLTVEPDEVIVMARPKQGAMVGDMQCIVRTGDEFLGNTYDELVAMGSGEHKIKNKKPKDKTV